MMQQKTIYYTNLRFVEVEIGVFPLRTQYLSNNMQAQRKQYGLKYRVTIKIHAVMGDKLPSMATEISRSNSNFKIWDKDQMIVIFSRTNLVKHIISVGDKN